MPEYTEHAPGTFCWTELITTDADDAKRFYCELFGWEYRDDPVGPDAVYTMLTKGDNNVGALYQRSKEQEEQGVPSHWGSYVSCENADATVATAKELGATVVLEPFDVFDIGRMAVLQDPEGAFLSIWQARKHIGATLKDEPGSFCWNELWTRDIDKAGSFYTRLFDWSTATNDLGGTDYTSFMKGEIPAGGMFAIEKQWGDVPPCWCVYFAVEDCDAAATKVTELGGTITVPPTDIPGVGRFAIILDPQGAAIGIIKMAQQH